MPRTAVILLAAGSGKRMDEKVADKVLSPLAGEPLFSFSAGAFAASGVADLFVIVYRDQKQMRELAALAPTPSLFVPGGTERQYSVANALDALPADIGHVFIHDCARPFIQVDHLVALHKIVRKEHAVVLAHRVTDTIKLHRDTGRLKTLERSALWAMETPQVFDRDLIVKAYNRAANTGAKLTDDASAVELLRHPVAMLENDSPNPKLTTPADLPWFEFLNNELQAADR